MSQKEGGGMFYALNTKSDRFKNINLRVIANVLSYSESQKSYSDELKDKFQVK